MAEPTRLSLSYPVPPAIERGLDRTLPLVDRERYPETECFASQ